MPKKYLVQAGIGFSLQFGSVGDAGLPARPAMYSEVADQQVGRILPGGGATVGLVQVPPAWSVAGRYALGPKAVQVPRPRGT